MHRVPADRPGTAAAVAAAEAAARGDGLAALWAAEAGPSPWRDCLGADSGQTCGQCGGPLYWTGAHTALACPDHDLAIWHVSPGARARAAEYLAAIDRTAARKTAQLADPAAERAAAEELAAGRAELADELEGLAEELDTRNFPRAEPYLAARQAGIRLRGVALHYLERARRAQTLDQLERVGDDAAESLGSAEAWADRIGELREQLAEDDDRTVIRGYLDDDGQGDAYATPRRATAQREARALLEAAQLPAGLAELAAADDYTPRCARCRAEHRRGPDGRWFPAMARAEVRGGPSEDVCADHLAALQLAHRGAVAVAERYDTSWAAYDRGARLQAAGAAVPGYVVR